MRYYLEYKDNKVVGYLNQTTNSTNKKLIEVEPSIFKNELKKIGVEIELDEDKIEALQEENANLLKDSAMKDISISMLQEENASTLKDSAIKDMLIETLQTDVADILKSMAQV